MYAGFGIKGMRLIKVIINTDREADEQAREEGFKQADVYRQSGGVPEVYNIDTITVKGRDFYAVSMEHVDGDDLVEYFAKNKPTKKETVDLLKKVVRGIGGIHAAGYAHRDIKPANIKVTQTGDVKILDFGIAANLNGKGLDREKTLSGTPTYMAPEQVEGRVDQRSDIYALGCTLFEMLKGETPLEYSTMRYLKKEIDHVEAQAMLKSILKFDINKEVKTSPEVQKALSRLGKGFEYIITTCLQKNPKKRFQNCEQIIEALDRMNETDASYDTPVKETASAAGIEKYFPGLAR
jgi:serine/threonine protein kinase